MFARFVDLILRLRFEDDGTAYVEYVVLGALAVFAILGTIQYFFGAISALFIRLGQMVGTL